MRKFLHKMMNRKQKTLDDLFQKTASEALKIFRLDASQFGIEIFGIDIRQQPTYDNGLDTVRIIFNTQEELSFYHLVGSYEPNWFISFTTLDQTKFSVLKIGEFTRRNEESWNKIKSLIKS